MFYDFAIFVTNLMFPEDLLNEFANVLDSVPNETVDYTDSVVGMRHQISLRDLAAALRSLPQVGDGLTADTNPFYELWAARLDDDVSLSNSFHAALDVANAYLAWLKKERSVESLLAFEKEASDCLECLQGEIRGG